MQQSKPEQQSIFTTELSKHEWQVHFLKMQVTEELEGLRAKNERGNQSFTNRLHFGIMMHILILIWAVKIIHTNQNKINYLTVSPFPNLSPSL